LRPLNEVSFGRAVYLSGIVGLFMASVCSVDSIALEHLTVISVAHVALCGVLLAASSLTSCGLSSRMPSSPSVEPVYKYSFIDLASGASTEPVSALAADVLQ